MLPKPSSRHLWRKVHPRITQFLDNKKNVVYFTITLSFLTLSFFGLFAIRPTLITATSLIKSVSDLRKLNLDYEEKIGSLIRAQSEYEKIRNSLPMVESAIPNTATFPQLAKALEKFAQLENLKIIQLQIDNVPVTNLAVNNQLQQYNFNIVISGDYPSLSSYIQHLLNWKRIVNISSLNFNLDISTSSGNLQLSMKGTTYYVQ
ncbi:hypothetical protein FJY90_03215 [Candidatus Gottesmanbacteria bacterium]|nr:hypothetical protein [Candidatus Gottesmanbacteria bacterium]